MIFGIIFEEIHLKKIKNKNIGWSPNAIEIDFEIIFIN